MSPPSIDLLGAHEIVSGSDASPTVTITITPQIEIAELIPEWNAGDGNVALIPPDFGETKWHLQFTPSSNRVPGEVKTRINLRTILADGQPGPEIQIPVTGRIRSPVRFSPSRLTFVSGRVSDSSTVDSEMPGDGESSDTFNSEIVAIVGANGVDWSVVSVEHCPDWLRVETAKAGELRLSMLNERPPEESAELAVLLKAAGFESVSLALRVDVIR